MAHSKTYIDPNVPFNVARVGAVVGNPTLDVGYQCRDERPFYSFSRLSTPATQAETVPGPGQGGDPDEPITIPTYYTTLRPDKVTQDTEVAVYRLTTTVKDGETYNGMTYSGTGTQNGASLTVGALTYTNTDNAYVDIRLFKVNKWAKYKPQISDQFSDLSDAQRAQGDYPYGLKVTQPSKFEELHTCTYAYAAVPGALTYPGGLSSAFRLTDFAGYNHLARPDVRGLVQWSGTVVTVGFTEDISEATGAVQLTELVAALSGHELTDFYPCLLASMSGANGAATYAHYAIALKAGATARKYTSAVDPWTADLGSISGYASGREWKLTVFFCSALQVGLKNLTNWQNVSDTDIPSSVDVFAVPDAVALVKDGGDELPTMKATALTKGLTVAGQAPSSYRVTFEWPDGYDEDVTYWAETLASMGVGAYTFEDVKPIYNSTTQSWGTAISVNLPSQYVFYNTVTGKGSVTVSCMGQKGTQTAHFGNFKLETP